jgi:hypothetical protein
VGRLDDIIARNQNPRAHRKRRFPFGLMMSAFVLLVLVLMIFTDLGTSPMPAPQPLDPDADKRVDGVKLYRAPAQPADAGVDAP